MARPGWARLNSHTLVDIRGIRGPRHASSFDPIRSGEGARVGTKGSSCWSGK